MKTKNDKQDGGVKKFFAAIRNERRNWNKRGQERDKRRQGRGREIPL
jgi:hypothetical protein